MSTYRVATGADVALVDLNVLAPQPRSEGVKAVRRSYVASGAAYEEGLYVELEYNVQANATAYVALLTQFGLHTALTATVTLYARNALYAWTRYTGLAVRPQIGQDGAWTNYFPRNFTILVKDLRIAT